MIKHRIIILFESSEDGGTSWERRATKNIDVPATLEAAAQVAHDIFHVAALASGVLRNPIGMAAALLERHADTKIGDLLAHADSAAMSEPVIQRDTVPAPEPEPKPEPAQQPDSNQLSQPPTGDCA